MKTHRWLVTVRQEPRGGAGSAREILFASTRFRLLAKLYMLLARLCHQPSWACPITEVTLWRDIAE